MRGRDRTSREPDPPEGTTNLDNTRTIVACRDATRTNPHHRDPFIDTEAHRRQNKVRRPRAAITPACLLSPEFPLAQLCPGALRGPMTSAQGLLTLLRWLVVRWEGFAKMGHPDLSAVRATLLNGFAWGGAPPRRAGLWRARSLMVHGSRPWERCI